ncbi:SDR family oxidoreductase [Thiohalomonas denitrificans]|uniref:SDR family oxidoreductase n=1 Tax=Thiohalomonas denitrificans TaxID=415747 RepID=UPI0026EC37D7|nr:SDR family oxidoreductase [Thiohalomonas denitrificans]
MDRVFIIGFGDVGRRVAATYRSSGTVVSGLTRHPESADSDRAGVRMVLGDLDRAATLEELPTAGSLVYYFAPPPPEGISDPRMAAFLEAASQAPPMRVVYISTSGIYGDRAGARVDETAEPHPETDRARRRLDAENRLRGWGRQQQVPVVILRVGGIYGPRRLPVTRLRKRLPVLRESECGYTSRIHVEDLVAACRAAAERGQADTIYNVSDGHPGTMTGYFKAVATRLGLPAPPEVSMAEAEDRLSAAMLSYLTESRRLDNRRLTEELGVRLRYPDLESGLAAIDPARELAS